MERWAIEIDRDDITHATLVAEDEAPLPEGSIEVAIDLVAITANNVTYAALGAPQAMLGEDAGYWDFFAERDAPGRLPAWGFATVTRSDVAGLPVGERLYGYWPLASHAILLPDRVGAVGFVEATLRRQKLPPFYNGYQRVDALDDHAAADHDLWPLFRPLYLTGWMVADQLADARWHDAAQVIVTAASSKTAIGFAHAVRDYPDRPTLIALTSARSAAFVKDSGLYDAIVLYDDIAKLPTDDAVLVDFANDAKVVRAVRDRLGAQLVRDLVVGFTHWDAATETIPFDPPRTTFFAPLWLRKRAADWGEEGLRARIGSAWRGFMADARRLAMVEHRRGGEAALDAWRAAVNGTADPRVGVLIGR